MMNKIISVVGPTASGKTALSVGLAETFDAEIVSVDSMQIYRGMDIGTAKVTDTERRGIAHHMIDCLDPNENCNVQKFVTMARRAVDDVVGRGKNCVLAGGTGLYVDHLLSDTKFVDVPTDLNLRSQLNQLQDEELGSMLRDKDPEAFSRLHPNDRKRIVRALEVFLLTGKSIGYWDAVSHDGSDPLNAVMIGLNFVDRSQLYARIDQRVDAMMEDGLLSEVRYLLTIDGFVGATAAAAIGYKEIISYLNHEISLDEAVAKIKLNTRHYAKRQLTWFKRNRDINWIDISAETSADDILNQAIQIVYRS